MAFFRILAVALPIAILVLGFAYLGTREARYLRWAYRLLQVGVVAGLIFFGVLIAERAFS